MVRYLALRLAQAVLVVAGVLVVTFWLLHSLPGTLARTIIGARATAAQVASFDRTNGLDRSLPVQFFDYVGHALHGNLGFSFQQDRPVMTVVRQDLPKDVLLIGSSMVLALLIAIPVGMLQAKRRNTVVDHVSTGISFTLYSTPSYVLGLLLVGLLSIQFHVFPAEAPQGTSVGTILTHPSGLILPVVTLTLITYALFSRYMRSSAIDALSQDYVRTARAKGLSERQVLLRHVLRNALIPIATLLGLALPAVLTAGLVVEQVFNFPGLGLAYFNAATADDYPVLLGVTLMVGVTTVVGNLVADLIYAVLDPRIRLGSGA